MKISGIEVVKIYEISCNYGNNVFNLDLNKESRDELVYVEVNSKSGDEYLSISPEELKLLEFDDDRLKIMRDDTLFKLRKQGIEC